MDRGSYITSRKLFFLLFFYFISETVGLSSKRDLFCIWRPYLKNGFLLMEPLGSGKTRSLFLSQNLQNNKIKLSKFWMGKWFTVASPKLSHSLINNQNWKMLWSSLWHLNLWKKKLKNKINWNFQTKCKVGWNLPYSPSNNTNLSLHLPCCCKRPTHRAVVGDIHPSYLTQGFQVGHQLQFPQLITQAPWLPLLRSSCCCCCEQRGGKH